MADSILAPDAPAEAVSATTAAAPETVALNAGGLPAAAPGTDENVFTFWPRHNAAIYQALADRHTQVEIDAAPGGEGCLLYTSDAADE